MTDQPEHGPVRAWEWLGLAAAMLLGGVLRFWALDKLPPGLWYDEAIYGLDGLSVLRERGWPIFFMTYGHAREPLYIYMLAGRLLFSDASALAIRQVSALIGTLTIPAVWWMAREMRGPRVALFAAFFFGGMRWHVHFSRIAFRAILSGLMPALLAAVFFRMVRKERLRESIALGAVGGLALYTYLSMRLFVLVPAIAALAWVCVEWKSRGNSRPAKLVGAAAVAGALVFGPLAVDFARHPEHFHGREQEISLLDQGAKGWKQIALQARDVALMFHVRGDHEPKHGIPGGPRFVQAYLLGAANGVETEAEWADAAAAGEAPDVHGTGYPAFDVLTGIVLVIGACVLVRNVVRRDGPALFVALWIGLGSLASILSFGAPNQLRMLALTPAIALLLGEGLDLLVARAWPRGKALGVAVAVIALGWFVSGETWRYFGVWARHPRVAPAFNTNFTNAAQRLREAPGAGPIIVPQFLAEAPTFIFEADRVRTRLRDDNPDHPPTIERGAWLLQPYQPYPALRLAGSDELSVRQIEEIDAGDGTPWAAVYEVVGEPSAAADGSAIPAATKR